MSKVQVIDHPTYNRRVGDEGKPFYEGEYNGVEARFYESGAVSEAKTGKMLKPLITRDNAGAIQAMAKEQTRERTRAKLIKIADERGIDARSAPAVIAEMVGVQVERILDGQGKIKESTDATLQIARLAGLAGDGRENSVKLTDPSGRSIEGDPEVLRGLLGAIRGE